MRASFTQLYVHYVWATWDRLPVITPDIQKLVYAAIAQECEQLKCTVIAIGGIEDHVHLLTGFPSTVSIRTKATWHTYPLASESGVKGQGSKIQVFGLLTSCPERSRSVS